MIELKDIAAPFGAQGFVAGLGVAALAYFLAPPLKKTFQPVIDRGAKEITELGSKAKELFKEGNQKIRGKTGQNEEMLAAVEKVPEIAGEMMKMSKDMQEQREMSLQVMRDLKDALSGLKKEMESLKKGMQSVTQQ